MRGVDATTNILPCGGSYHWSVFLMLQLVGTPQNRPFRFEAFWLENPTFMENIKAWWEKRIPVRGSNMYNLRARLKHMKVKLKQWNKMEFGNIFQLKKELEQKMEALQQKMISEGYSEDIKEEEMKLLMKWEERCKQEEILWRQKSRLLWLRKGEKNTKFFDRRSINEHRNSK